MNFRKVNRLAGWIAFAISLTIYFLTLEPTVSYWDCGEFLSCAVNLEVPHAPGAPFFILLGRLASMLYPANPTIMVNGLSAISSAFTILFLFFTISWFGRKLFAKTWEHSVGQKIIIVSGAFIGAMAYAVSDSFWFSAVETEVYALSSLFTAVVFWCITRWEESPADDTSERWLLLIAYLLGLSIGVHLLNLLAIPAIVLVYFIRKYPFNARNLLKAIGVSVGLLLAFLFFIPGIPALLSSFELMAVNGMGLPFNSGLLIGIGFIALALYFAHLIAVRKGTLWLQRVVVYSAFVWIGFSPYGIVLVRSHDNPSIDMANPDNPFSLENYLNREQYGKRPLLYGQSFASPVIAAEERSSYQRFEGKYVKYPLNPDIKYDRNTLMPFPRLCSDEPGHVEAYKSWIGNYQGRPYYSEAAGKQIQLPTFGENLRFFFSYQLGHMYFRYFMWNFAGRQNDILGRGNVMNGNWLSGFSFIDNMRLGPQDQLPTHLKTNKAYNRYFCLPLLLGLLGLWFHYKNDKKQFWVATLFFLLTGIAIAVYLNEVPIVPRERDYVYVGSFYVFAIWLGIGVMALYSRLSKMIKSERAAALASSILALGIPALMCGQNWDDHSRAKRYAVLEYARNYLESCEPNAILFTNADNDTYPLWYAQEVEGIRRDIRIVLSPYLSADWYVNQMRAPQFKQHGLAMHISQDKYVKGKRTYLPIVERTDSAVDVNEMLEFAASDDQRAKIELTSGEKINYIPSRKVVLTVPASYQFSGDRTGAETEDSLPVNLSGSHLRMDNLVLLDLIASNNWKRPVYFASPQVTAELGLTPYLQLSGFAYKLVPRRENVSDNNNVGYIDAERLYNQYMKQFSFTSIENSAVYLDYTHIYQLNVMMLRNKFARLAEALINKGDTARAEKVLDRITAMLPNERLAYELWNIDIARLYLRLGNRQKGRSELLKLKNFCYKNLRYFNGLTKFQMQGVNYEVRLALYMLQQIAKLSEKYGYSDVAADCKEIWESKTGRLLEAVSN
ncbi:MAG TPA: DUF2723 domain-containing protein [Bacteroidales bacterium]|nr:DUF2723 domain-containing protein [Bacteroidales bacterium]